MDAPAAQGDAAVRAFSRGALGALDERVAGTLAAASGDLAMVIDRDGVIRDVAVSNPSLVAEGPENWIDQRWADTVTVESRPKIDQMLRDARRGGRSQWREINQITARNDSVLVRFLAVDAGRDGRIIAIGRDGRGDMALQQRLIQAQQSMERDYARLRDAEFRYRLLFRMSSEAVVIVDAATRRVVEANPASERMIGRGAALNGESFVRLFAAEDQEAAASLLAIAQSTSRPTPAEARLRCGEHDFYVSASLFRQDRATFLLVRFAPAGEMEAAGGDPGLEAVLERVPDAFVITDEALKIVAANAAFLDLVRIASFEQARGQSVQAFIGRAGMERNLLLEALQAHGSVRNFATVLRTQFDDPEDLEVSAVAAPDGGKMRYGMTLRPVGRRMAPVAGGPPEFRRSAEQLAELVGRVTLKELVRETTDLVEKLCIEAALELTKNNRASAAEILGLSRQSLYSKLHRFGLATAQADDD